MAIIRPAAPVRDPLVDPKTGLVTTLPWLTWLRDVRDDLDAAPRGFTPVSKQAQTAAIGTTSIPTDGNLSKGLYRVRWFGKVVTVAGVSSSFQVTVSWTSKTQTLSFVGGLMNGNLLTTYESNGPSGLIYVDAATPVTYAVAYASNPATVMAYDLFLTLERLAAL